MTLVDISSDEYKEATKGKCAVFCSRDFLELNKGKVDKVRYFLGREKMAFCICRRGKG